MKQQITNQVTETEQFAERLAKEYPAPQVFCLYGDLGAGKTAFTRGLVRGYGSCDHVSSPTFTIMHEYEGDAVIHHFDLYRIESEDELFDIGFDEFLTEGIAVIEWPDRFLSLLPDSAVHVTLRYGEAENQRIIEVLP